MIVISAKDIKKSYGADEVLRGISFHVNEGDRIGIIGGNGAGKTTLLNILTGGDEASSGDIFVSADLRVGYLRQQDDFRSDNTVIEEAEQIFRPLEEMEAEMLALSQEISDMAAAGEDTRAASMRYDDMRVMFERRGGYSYRSEMRGVLSSMAFTEDQYDKPVSELSGGERTRLSLACLLLRKPEIILLDEPTNHLDIGTLKWLEQYLNSYRGTMMIVSHDRYFLDRTVNRIFEIENGKLEIYEGNYSDYAKLRAEKREAEMRAYKKQSAEIARQEDMVRRFRQRGTEKLAKRARSREIMLEKMDRPERPAGERGKIKIRFRESYESGKDVLHIEGLAKSFGYGPREKRLFDGIDLDVRRGEKICIVGANGIGKTTFMRIILGEIKPTKGYIRRGHNVKTGYYDQRQEDLDPSKTVLDELHDAYALYTDAEIRSLLGRFLFMGDDVFIKVGSLSGGEKARLALLKLMLSGANLLLLDEPTNHLDIDSKEVFEDALAEFPGTALIISHDRYFLNKIPTRIMEMTESGFNEYLGKYDYFVEKRDAVASGKKYLGELAGSRPAGGDDALTDGEGPRDGGMSNEEQWRARKAKETEERRKKREQEELENRIGELEARQAEIEAEMLDESVMNDYHKLEELSGELESLKEELNRIYEKWLQY
ncbi:MAG: ABC-F family ATP-binding cassette domain-containing protein [Anaerovoracaceae bacterium]|nr:ABC-F family ATP-binding cassette domain-containing protein [Anaerovoracaceae bacterium]